MEAIDIEDLLSRWDGAWLVDGRPVTNMEMTRLSEVVRQERWDRVQRRDCTDCEGPWEDGICRHGCGKCVFVRDAEKLIWRYENDGKDRINHNRETHGADRPSGEGKQPGGD